MVTGDIAGGTAGPPGRAVAGGEAGGAGRATAAVGARGEAAGGIVGLSGRAAITDAPLAVAGDKAAGVVRAGFAVGALGATTGGTHAGYGCTLIIAVRLPCRCILAMYMHSSPSSTRPPSPSLYHSEMAALLGYHRI